MSTRPRRVIRAPAVDWAPTAAAPPPQRPPRGRGRGRGGRGGAVVAPPASMARESSRPRRHAEVKSYAEVEDEEVEEEGEGTLAGLEEETKAEVAVDGAAGSDTASDPLPDVDEDDDDEREYERTHRLVMEPQMLPSGRPAVHHILAHRPTPAGWRTPAQPSIPAPHVSSSSSSSSASIHLDLSPSAGNVDGADEELLGEMDSSVRALVESSSLLMAHLRHHFFCTFKHMSFLHTAWLPLSALMEEGVKMKIKLSKYLRGDTLLLDGEDDEEQVREELIDSDFTCVDKILAAREGRRRDDIAGVRRFWPEEAQQKARSAAVLPLHPQHPHPHQPAPPSSSQSDQRSSREYLVKWSSLPYSASTWERPVDFCDSLKIDQFEQQSALPTPARLHSRRLHPTKPPPSAWQKLAEGVEYKAGNQLRPWQVEGVSWLLFNWHHGKGSILADEMGLGKTVQIVACLQHILSVYAEGPFLVVVPLSTIQHWKREFEQWTDMNVVLLQGSKHDRDMIVEYEWSYRDASGEEKWRDAVYKFHVCIATYESVLAEQTLLSNIQWRVCAIDEAHRLKNKESKLFKALQQMTAEHRILLTGTPIQNNMDELWTLLHYIEPRSFPSLSSFISDYGHLQKTEQVTALQHRLAPYLLRRMKEDVAKKLPKKEETIIEVELTLLQKQYYRAVLERNRQWLQRGVKGSNVPKLLNVVMQLRKVCSHPFLIEGAEEKEYEEIRARMEEERKEMEQAAYDARVQAEQLKVLIGSSGKLTLCDKLLPRLQAEGHRVLIFSQMKLVLNLLEQYLELKGYEYERIDGNIRGNERQAAIDRFCKPGSSVFVFLLSTRAGGLGINLASADTVIIFDSDWNPQNDMQAQARAHRIGQTQQVKVYRLITSRTYEMEMFRRASLKLGLDQAVLRKMQVNEGRSVQYGQVDSSLTRLSQLDKKEVESLLKYGAYDLFNEAADAASQKFCLSEDMQVLTDRGFMSRAEVFAACPELVASMAPAAMTSDDAPLPFGGAVLTSKAGPLYWTPSPDDEAADALLGIRYEQFMGGRAKSAVLLRDSQHRFGRHCGLCNTRFWRLAQQYAATALSTHIRLQHAEEVAELAARLSRGDTVTSASATDRRAFLPTASTVEHSPLQVGGGPARRVSPQIKRSSVSHAKGGLRDDDVKVDDRESHAPTAAARPSLTRRARSSSEAPQPTASSARPRRISFLSTLTPHDRSRSAASMGSMREAYEAVMEETVDATARRAAATADIRACIDCAREVTVDQLLLRCVSCNAPVHRHCAEAELMGPAQSADDWCCVACHQRSPTAAASAPLLFASLDPSTGHLVYLPATALTWKTVTSLVEFTHAAEAPRWASDADEYGLTPGQAARMQAASDRARDGDTEGVDKFHVEPTSNGLSLIVDAHHDMFVRVGLSADDAGDVPNTVWASADYHKVKAGSLLSDDVRQRVKMLGQAKAGLAASADELPFAALLGLVTVAQVEAFLLVYGYWCGDGFLDSVHGTVGFAPKKSQDKTWVLERLAVLGLTEESGGLSAYDQANGQLAIVIRDERWSDYFFDEYGPKYGVASVTSSRPHTHTGPTVPLPKSVKWFWMWVWRLRKERARLVLDGLRFADGSESCDVNDIWTSGREFRDEIIRLCLHAGHSACFRLVFKAGDWRPGTGTDLGVPIQSRADGWMVSYSDHALAAEPVLRNLRDIRRPIVPREVPVWCPTVPPHSLIIARRVRKNAEGIVTQASRPIVVGNCEEDIDQILQKRTMVVTQQAEGELDDEEGDDVDEEADDDGSRTRRLLKRKREAGGSTFSKANFTSSTSDTAVDLHATDFWERVIPDQKSALKIKRRMETAAIFADAGTRAAFFADLFALVQEVIGQRQQGVEADNTAEVLELLMKMTEMGGEGEFTEEERLQASEWMQEIEKPKRQRRAMERWSDITNPALAEANGVDAGDGRASGEWSRGGDNKRRRLLKANSGRQFTRRERKGMISAVTTLAGLCPPTPPPPRSPSTVELEPPIADIWQAIHSLSGLTDRPFEEFAAFSLAFLAYCSRSGDDEDSSVFLTARQRLIVALPPPGMRLQVKEEMKAQREVELEDQEMKDTAAALDERDKVLTSLPAPSPPLSSSSQPPGLEISLSASLSPPRDLPPPAVVRSQTSHSTTSPPSSSAPPPPAVVPVRSSSLTLMTTTSERHSRQGRSAATSRTAPPLSQTLDPRTATSSDFPSMSTDKQFHKHVMKRAKKWSRYLALQQLVQAELERQVNVNISEAPSGTTKAEGAADVIADSDVEVFSEEEGEDEESSDSSDSDEEAAAANPVKSAMTVRSRGKRWKRESMREQQRRVREEGKRRRAAGERLRADAALQQRLQRRFGAFFALSVPSKVDRSPAWWWTAADDKALIVGISRHGTSFYDIETDPLLGFTRRLSEDSPAADGSDYDPFVDSVKATDPADGEALPASAPTMTATGSSGSSGGSGASVAITSSCICNQPRYGRATKGSTRVCVRCYHFFHLECLDKAREEGTLRPESFPPMPPSGYEKAQQEEEEEEEDEEEEEEDELMGVKKEEGAVEKADVGVDQAAVDDDAALASTVKLEPKEELAMMEGTAEGPAKGEAEEASTGRSTRLHGQRRGQDGGAQRGRGGRGRGKRGVPASDRSPASTSEAQAAAQSEAAAVDPAVTAKGVQSGGGEEDEDDEDEGKVSQPSGRSYINGGWLCDRCEMSFPSDRALELRLRSLLEAFERDRRSLLRLADRSERVKAAQREKRKKAEEVSSVWTKKERARFQRAIQMYGSSDTALQMMRKRMGLKNKSEAMLRAHCDRYLTQCRLLVAAARREQDLLTYATSRKELKVRGEELRLLKLRVERLVLREREMEQRKEERRRAKGGGGGGGAEADSDDDLSGYCVCEGKVDDPFMICCDAQLSGCKEWYHGQCVGISQDNLPTNWICPRCTRGKATDTSASSSGRDRGKEKDRERERGKEQERVEAEPRPLLPVLQVHPPSPMSAHVLSSHSAAASTPALSSAHTSAPPTSVSVSSTFSYPPQQTTFDPPTHAHPYSAQPYPTFQQQQQQQEMQYRYQQQHQHLAMAQSPMYGAPGGYSLVNLSHPAGVQQYTTYMLPPHYQHPMQSMSGQPTPVYINGQPVLMQPMPTMDMQAMPMGYYQQAYQPTYVQQQPPPSMLYGAYHPMQVAGSPALQPHPHPPVHQQPQSAFVPTLATSMPVAPVVPLGAQPPTHVPVQPLQPLAAPVQPLAPPPEASLAASPAPPALPLALTTTPKPPSPLAPPISVKAPSSVGEGGAAKPAGLREKLRRDEEPNRPAISPGLSKKPSPIKTRSPPSPPPPPTSSTPIVADASPSPPAAGVSDDAPRAAAWKVRRQLYSTSAAAMALQMNKLLAEQHKEQLKLAEWKRQRIDLTEATPAAPSTSSTPPSSTLRSFALVEGEDRISLHLAQKVLTRVLLLDYLRATSQRCSDAELKEKLAGAPLQSMPTWWQPPLHDWSCIRGVLDHGLGMIEDIITDPALSPAWAAAVQAEKREKRDGKAFLAIFLRDKGPLLRRLHVACNWAVLRSTRNPSEEWLEWLLTSKRELRSTAFRVNQNVSAYNATSSHTLAALSEATEANGDDKAEASSSRADRAGRSSAGSRGGGSGALLSIQSISNWARMKEGALKMQPVAGASVSADRGRREERSSSSEAAYDRADSRRSRSSPKRSRGRSSYSSSSSSGDDSFDDDDSPRRRRKRPRRDSRRRSSRSKTVDRRFSEPPRRPKRARSSRRPASSTGPLLRLDARPRALPKVAPRDSHNRPILPLPIKGGITIVSLGRIVTDRPLYHTTNTIYPVGFTSQRVYWSLKHPTTRVQWTSRIDDGGKSPLFVVTPGDDPSAAIINRTASGAWGEAIRKVHRLKGKGHLKVTQSGPMIFGVANSLVKQLINEMEGADVIRLRWEEAKEEEDNDGEVVEVEEAERDARERDETRVSGRGRGQVGAAGNVEEGEDELDDADEDAVSGSESEDSEIDSDSRSSSGSEDDSESDTSDSLSVSSDERGDGRGKRRREATSTHHHDERSRRDSGKRRRRH